jgi:hypothetical protein
VGNPEKRIREIELTGKEDAKVILSHDCKLLQISIPGEKPKLFRSLLDPDAPCVWKYKIDEVLEFKAAQERKKYLIEVSELFFFSTSFILHTCFLPLTEKTLHSRRKYHTRQTDWKRSARKSLRGPALRKNPCGTENTPPSN